MLPEAGFEDQFLAESLYHALFDRFYEACDESIQALLEDCTFGIAPDRAGVKTFFILASDLSLAKALSQHVDTILARVGDLMPGVAKTAICCVPSDADDENCYEQFPPKFMMGRVFDNPEPSELHS
jgi:hypothetical protein